MRTDYKITYYYLTESGDSRFESELVHSYQQGFTALNAWLYKNQDCGYTLVKVEIKEF